MLQPLIRTASLKGGSNESSAYMYVVKEKSQKLSQIYCPNTLLSGPVLSDSTFYRNVSRDLAVIYYMA